MSRQYNLEWLAQEGFEYSGYVFSFIPPNYLEYSHPDGRSVSMEDDEKGRLLGDGPPPDHNRDTLTFFRVLIEAKTKNPLP